MTKLTPVKDAHALYRDEKSNAIVSTDMNEYQRYVQARKQKQLDRDELDTIKDEIREIKEMLRNLSNGN